MSLVSLIYLHFSVFLRSWCKFREPVKYAARNCVERCISVSTTFIKIIKLLIWFLMYLIFQFSVSVTKKLKIVSYMPVFITHNIIYVDSWHQKYKILALWKCYPIRKLLCFIYEEVYIVARNGILIIKWRHYGLKGYILDYRGILIFWFTILLYHIYG